MKILYITNYKTTAQLSGGFINDYLNDLLFYGLTQIDNVEITDSTPIIHLYKQYQSQIPISSLWGMGFTSTFLIDKDNVDRNNIEDKIRDKYYDIIIYGNIRRCQDYYGLVKQYYPDNKIVCVDGNDDVVCDPEFYTKHVYFKRELIWAHPLLKPINFAIPNSKITNNFYTKEKDYGLIIPGESGYRFNNETDYYSDYNKSYYGITMKKAGWDCMRHYEILANNCVPYFIDLESCPSLTLTNLPKSLLLEARYLAENFEIEKYDRILKELFEFTKENLTTKQLAEYFLKNV